MKRSTGAVLISMVKWVVVPAALAALGFYVVGPKVAQKYMSPPTTVVVEKNDEPVEEDRPATSGAPKVEVSATKIKNSSSSRRRRKLRSRPAENTEIAIPQDEVGSEPSPEPELNPAGNDDGEAQING